MAQAIESTLTAVQKDSLEITDFIFHIILPITDGPTQVQYSDEVHLAEKQKKFFLKILQETLTGTQYIFQQEEAFLKTKCLEVIKDKSKFNAISRALTKDFAGRHTGQMSAGIFIFAVAKYLAKAGVWKNLVLLLKMDQNEIFSYRRIKKDERWIVVVDEVNNPLSDRKDSIQKSAVIDVEGNYSWNVLAVDRGKKVGLADFFEAFLGVIAREDASELTRRALSSVRQWANKLPKESFPPNEDANTFTGRALNYLKDNADFDSDKFIETVVRDIDEDRREKLKTQLREKLTETGIYGQKFVPKPDSLPKRDRISRYITAEGVTIEFEGDVATAGIKMTDLPDGRTEVKIITSKVIIK